MSTHASRPIDRRTFVSAGAAALGALVTAEATPGQGPGGRLLYVGTYTGADSKGIYAFRFNESSGALTPLGLVADTPNPSFLALDRTGRVLYTVNEVGSFDGGAGGTITSLTIDTVKGTLTPINREASRGADPCHLQCDATGRFLAVANYTGGNTALLPVAANGRLSPATVVVGGQGSGPNVARQKGPHAHQAVFDPGNRFLLVADLGIDQILVHRFDAASGRVEARDPPSARLAPGSGPRHLAFSPDGRFVFVINELLSTITTFSWTAASGTLARLGTVSTLPKGHVGDNSTAEIAVHPSGRFLYGSNRGHDSLAMFSIAGDGTLTPVGHVATRGRTPRHFTIDPSGRWLLAANQASSTLAVFRIDQATGGLTPVDPLTPVGSPVCLLFVPTPA